MEAQEKIHTRKSVENMNIFRKDKSTAASTNQYLNNLSQEEDIGDD